MPSGTQWSVDVRHPSCASWPPPYPEAGQSHPDESVWICELAHASFAYVERRIVTRQTPSDKSRQFPAAAPARVVGTSRGSRAVRRMPIGMLLEKPVDIGLDL